MIAAFSLKLSAVFALEGLREAAGAAQPAPSLLRTLVNQNHPPAEIQLRKSPCLLWINHTHVTQPHACGCQVHARGSAAVCGPAQCGPAVSEHAS
eukprot:1156388-Pelagomonas_calceolata.AAC.6